MKIKTAQLIGRALDWAVAVATGHRVSIYGLNSIRAMSPTGAVIAPFQPTFYWSQGGPIMEQENINPFSVEAADVKEVGGKWGAGINPCYDSLDHIQYGPTMLIAAMRCYVASKLGDEVDIPEELTS